MRSIVVIASAGCAGAAAGLALLAACLPDLASPAAPPVEPMCGDGVIAPAAGEECDPGDGGNVIGCRDCKIDCDGGAFDRRTSHCYFSASFTNDFATADGRCREAGAHIASFVSEDELAFVAAASPTDDFWVNLVHNPAAAANAYAPSPDTFEPGWSPTCSGCYAHLPPGTTVVPRQPGGGAVNAPGTDCVIAEKSLTETWYRSLCVRAASRETMCEREPVGSRTVACDGGGGSACFTVAATAGTKRYVVDPSPVRADQVDARCAALGGSAVTFASREEREQVAREITLQHVAPRDTFWIGLTRGPIDGGDATWSWSGAEVLSDASPPLPWGENEPSLAGTRAYVRIAAGEDDSSLARAGSDADLHPSVCSIP